MIKVALADICDGAALHTAAPFNGERVLVVSNYHEVHGAFKATTILVQSTTIVAEPDLGAGIILTSFVISARKKNLAIVTLSMTDGVNTEEVFSAELTNEAVNMAATGLIGWRGWDNARMELTLSGADTNVHVTLGYTKVPHSVDYEAWDANR